MRSNDQITGSDKSLVDRVNRGCDLRPYDILYADLLSVHSQHITQLIVRTRPLVVAMMRCEVIVWPII